MLTKRTAEEIKTILENRKPKERLLLQESLICDEDLSGWDLHNIDLQKSDFRNVKLDEANMSDIDAENGFFGGCTLHGTNLQRANLAAADFRGCDLSKADISGANMYCSALWKANLTDIKADEHTKFFHPSAPEAPFIGWKVCFGRRIVQLLVPADARISGTNEEVKVDKAKVLSIKSEDYMEQYAEAYSYVDEDFVYRVGKMKYDPNFNPNRFVESGGGIHVWLTREEAVAYLV